MTLSAESLLNLADTWYDLCDTDRQILRLLQNFYRKHTNPLIQPRRQWFTEKIGVGICAISRSLTRLRDNGWIISKFRGRKGNVYELPDWLKKLDLTRPDKWMDIDMECAEEVLETPKKSLAEYVVNLVKATVKDTIKATISPLYNSVPVQPNRSSNTGTLGGCGNVHVAPLHEQSHTSDVGFFQEINLETKTPQQVTECWTNVWLADGSCVTQKDIAGWLRKGQHLAVHGAMIAYYVELDRRSRKQSKSKTPGIKFVQWLLSTGRWKKILRAAKNRDTAMQHLVGESKAFYQVTDTTAYMSKGQEIALETIPVMRFEQMIRYKGGIEPKSRVTTFNKYIPV